jgi:hypothetical protein
MGWTVIIEDENGHARKTMPDELILSNMEVLGNESFKLLRYLNPFGDTTFNTLMLKDLMNDLVVLKKLLPSDAKQIDEVIEYAKECSEHVHTYLKFYGD